ncbi:MAG: TonB family protein [Spirosomaceae bacterium]|jgi:protein TonB|nr:TonB family protein [Spirosomataceae bacterium]
MEQPKNASNLTLDEIVFANRNREYGAYTLRKNYAKYLTRAALLGVGLFGGMVLAAWGFNKFGKSEEDELQTVEIDLSKLKEEKQEEKKPELPPPPPPPEQKPPEVAQIKFLPPEPKADEEVKQEEPPPKMEETEKAVISNVTKEGEESEEIAAAPPPPVEEAKPAEIEKPREDEIFTSVEQQPEFPGGNIEALKYIGKNLKYPSAAQRANVSGKVFVKFVVEKDGSIGDVQILKGIGFGCDEEASRVIKTMPKWSPGKQNGRNVRVWFTLPISFVLE